MNIITNIAPIAAAAAGLASSPTLILAIGLLHLAAKAVSRLIPDTKTGVLGAIRKAAKVIGVEPANRVSDNTMIVGIADAAVPRATLQLGENGLVRGYQIAAQAEAVAPTVAVVADLTAKAKAVAIAQIAAGKLTSLLGKLKS